MRKIAEIVEDIHEELEGAEHYATQAAKYKAAEKELSSVYAGLATTELSHVDTLHSQVVKAINEQKATGKEVPAEMQDVWDWQHKQIAAKYAGVRALLEMAKKP